MKGKSFSAAIAAPLALAAMGAAVLPRTDTGSAWFDQEVRSVNQSLQRGEIVTETGAGPTSAEGGAFGPMAPTEGPPFDSGSRWFDSYVAQVNQQLRIMRQAEEPPASR